MPIDAEALGDVSTGEGRLHVLHTVGKAAALVGGEGDDGLALQVALMLLEESEHHLRIGAPPDRAANEHRVIFSQFDVALILGQLAGSSLFFGQFDERVVGHAVVLMRHDLELLRARQFRNVVGHDLRVAHLNVAYCVVVSRMREEHYQCFSIFFHSCFLFCAAAARR